MKRTIIWILITFIVTSFIACGHNHNTNLSEPKPEIGYYSSSGGTYEFIIDSDAARHPYNLELLINTEGDICYEGDANYTIRKGIDVSKWQKNVDWNQVKAAGYEFAFLRLGYRGYEEGLLHIDDTFHQNMENAQVAKMDLGVYFFSQALTEEEAIEEAKFLLDALKNYEISLPIVYDFELVQKDTVRTNGITGEQITKNSIAFCETIKNAGYTPMIYTNMYFQAELLDMSELQDYLFWYADYSGKPQTPYHFTFWQYSKTGSVNGINGNVDLNIQFIPLEKPENTEL